MSKSYSVKDLYVSFKSDISQYIIDNNINISSLSLFLYWYKEINKTKNDCYISNYTFDFVITSITKKILKFFIFPTNREKTKFNIEIIPNPIYLWDVGHYTHTKKTSPFVCKNLSNKNIKFFISCSNFFTNWSNSVSKNFIEDIIHTFYATDNNNVAHKITRVEENHLIFGYVIAEGLPYTYVTESNCFETTDNYCLYNYSAKNKNVNYEINNELGKILHSNLNNNYLHHHDVITFLQKNISFLNNNYLNGYLYHRPEYLPYEYDTENKVLNVISDKLINNTDEFRMASCLKEAEEKENNFYDCDDKFDYVFDEFNSNDFVNDCFFGLELEFSSNPTKRFVGLLEYYKHGFFKNECSCACELNLIRLKYKELKKILYLYKKFISEMEINKKCGMHVHVTKSFIIANAYEKLKNFYEKDKQNFLDKFGRLPNSYCTIDENGTNRKYRAINDDHYNTIEFRGFSGTNDVKEILKRVKWLKRKFTI